MSLQAILCAFVGIVEYLGLVARISTMSYGLEWIVNINCAAKHEQLTQKRLRYQ
jgi:hypothetical protein